MRINEIIKLDDKNIHRDFDYYKSKDLTVINNTNKEIMNAFEEMLQKVNNTKLSKKEIDLRNNLQDKINKIPYMKLLKQKLNTNISYSYLMKNYEIL